MSSEDELLALAKKVNTSNALRYAGRIEILRVNFFVFDRNYQELKKLINAMENPTKMLELWDLRNRHQLDVVINEILRLLHNLLASAKSLIDQTRIVILNWYKGTDFLEEYNVQLASRFGNSLMTKFIEDLRNFNLHYSLPITHATFSVHLDKGTGQSTIDHSFVLVKSSLFEWSGWTKKAKIFLQGCDDQIDIGALVDEYHRQILDFHTWLIKRLHEIHKEDLVWLAEMRQKTINAMSEEERKDRGLSRPETTNEDAHSQP